MPDKKGGMAVNIVELAIKFGIQTVFLIIALWIMLKVQKLQCGFLAMAGSAALASALDLIPYAGHVISLPVLLICITKSIGSKTFTDALLTVAVAYALTLCFNLLLLGMLTGDLRKLAETKPERPAATQSPAPSSTNTNVTTVKPPTNPPANPTRNTVTSAQPSNTAPVSNVAPPQVAVTPPSNTAPAATQPPPKPPPTAPTTPVKSGSAIAQNFVVRGIIAGTANPVATIYTGVRTHNIGPGEAVTMDTKDGRVVVHCKEVTGNKVVIVINDEEVTLFGM